MSAVSIYWYHMIATSCSRTFKQPKQGEGRNYQIKRKVTLIGNVVSHDVSPRSTVYISKLTTKYTSPQDKYFLQQAL